MKFATIRTDNGTAAVRLDGDRLVELGATDVGDLLSRPQWRELPATRASHDAATADFAPLVLNPSKVICVGHNYTNHIREMGRERPAYPTLFPKFADCLIGAHDDIEKPPETDALDWEVELVVVIGAAVRRANATEAAAAIAGFTVMNDISVRDWQFRTGEWTQGSPLGSRLAVVVAVSVAEFVVGVATSALAASLRVPGHIRQLLGIEVYTPGGDGLRNVEHHRRQPSRCPRDDSNVRHPF